MKKRWISLFVENQVGVLAKISGLFAAKCYNLESLTVGTTEDPTISRMTIATMCDDETYEQITKQLNRMVEVIKVIDFTEISVVMQELMFVKVRTLVERKVRDAVGLEVAHADRPQVARFIKPLYRAPCAINVAIRLMDQVQVDRVRSEQLERAPDGALGARF